MTKRKTPPAPVSDADAPADRTDTTAVPPIETPAIKTPRPRTKMATLVAILLEPEGASIAQMQAVTGWRQHSVRGALAGALKHKAGLTIASAKEEERGRVYRATPPDPAA